MSNCFDQLLVVRVVIVVVVVVVVVVERRGNVFLQHCVTYWDQYKYTSYKKTCITL